MAKNYINAWVKEQLLLQKAVFNLDPYQQASLERLIRQYRNDIFIKTYQEEWLKSRMDTLVTSQEIEAYYNENKQNFKLHQDLVRGRYVHVVDDKNYDTLFLYTDLDKNAILNATWKQIGS
jgi:hypothetical protein